MHITFHFEDVDGEEVVKVLRVPLSRRKNDGFVQKFGDSFLHVKGVLGRLQILIESLHDKRRYT